MKRALYKTLTYIFLFLINKGGRGRISLQITNAKKCIGDFTLHLKMDKKKGRKES